jgi:hypothetical protein
VAPGQIQIDSDLGQHGLHHRAGVGYRLLFDCLEVCAMERFEERPQSVVELPSAAEDVVELFGEDQPQLSPVDRLQAPISEEGLEGDHEVLAHRHHALHVRPDVLRMKHEGVVQAAALCLETRA